jgi:RimJ/RimL family protein N-acetyltransferase
LYAYDQRRRANSSVGPNEILCYMPLLTPPVVPPGTLSSRGQPEITREGLMLRPWTAADAPVLARAYSDPEIQQWHGRSLTEDEAHEWIAARARSWEQELAADWAVCGADGEVMARVTLNHIDLKDGLGAIGYWVLPEARGRRVATRSVRLLTDWALNDLGLHRIELEHSTRNPASCRVATRAGYVVDGTRRQHTLHPDGWHDMHLHARVAGDPAVPGRAVAGW